MDGHGTTSGSLNRETLAVILKVIAAVLALWALYDHLIVPIVLGEGGEGGTLPVLNRIGIHLLMLSPTIFYVCGIWLLARFLGDGAPGAQGVQRLKAASRTLLIGVLMDVIVVPTLLAWIVHRGGFALDAAAPLLVLAALALALPFTFGASAPRSS